jgi:flagellar assembly protein FliH
MSEPRPVSLAQYFDDRSGFRQRDHLAVAVPSIVSATDPYTAGLADGQQMAEAAFSVERKQYCDLIAAAEALRFEDNAEVAFLLDAIIRDVVTRICGTIDIDAAYLQRQIEVATAVLTEADTGRTLHLNPDDLALLSHATLPMACVADPDLPRATLRIACSDGWIEHGPAFALDRLKRTLSDTEVEA